MRHTILMRHDQFSSAFYWLLIAVSMKHPRPTVTERLIVVSLPDGPASGVGGA